MSYRPYWYKSVKVDRKFDDGKRSQTIITFPFTLTGKREMTVDPGTQQDDLIDVIEGLLWELAQKDNRIEQQPVNTPRVRSF